MKSRDSRYSCSSLGNRMKQYEKVSQSNLMRKTPVLIRLDGKAFHTYTKGFDSPFSKVLHKIRTGTLEKLCENIQGGIIGYAQSDEISLVLKDWDTYQTDAWYGNNLQKLVSVSASRKEALYGQEITGDVCRDTFVYRY